MPAPVVWAAPGEAPPELVCLVSRFYPPEGLEVVWELRDGPGGTSQKVKESQWLSALRHHSDGSVSVSGHLQLPPVTSGQHGARYFCLVRHPTLPAAVRSAEVTLEVAGKGQGHPEARVRVWEDGALTVGPLLSTAGLSGPSLEDGVGLFLSAFFLLGLFKVLGCVGECEPHQNSHCDTPLTTSQTPGTPYSAATSFPSCLNLSLQLPT